MDKLKKFVSDLKNLDKAKEYDAYFDTKADIIMTSPDKVFELVKSLPVETHTVPILYLLTALYNVPEINQKVNIRDFIMYSRRFLYDFSVDSVAASVYFETMFGFFVQLFAHSLLHFDSSRPHWKSSTVAKLCIDRPLLGIKPLKKAIQKLQTKDTQFTVCHPYFAMLCVKAKAYRHALPIVTKKILSGYTDPTKPKGGNAIVCSLFDRVLVYCLLSCVVNCYVACLVT